MNLQPINYKLHLSFIVLCIVGALAATLPRLLSQPIIFEADAELRFDTARYGGIYNLVAPRTTGFDIAFADAGATLRQNALARRELRYGLPNYQVAFLPQEPGRVVVRGLGPSAAEARTLADAGAEELVRQVRAAGGREILRNMLGWELYLALEPAGAAAPGPFDALLREIIRRGAFPMSRDLEPFSTPRALDDLPPEELQDLTRALEARYDLWRFALTTRDATLDALCATPRDVSTTARDALLARCATSDPAAKAELAERERDLARLRAIGDAVRFMTRQRGIVFQPDAPSAVQRTVAPGAFEQPRRIIELSLLAALLGLVFGAIGVGVDRGIGVAARVRELWGYRELVRNLVLRDLRARYKGSALGYLWTQLAPLLMMGVFVMVFGLIMPSGIAMFPVFVIVALLPWNFCAEAVAGGTSSVINNSSLIKKVFFPREVLPLASVSSALLNYLLSLPMMLLVMAGIQLFSIGRLNFSWTFAYLPMLLLIQTLFLAGLALFLGALAVFFRDIVHLIGILINLWFFLTPVFYSFSTFGESTAVRILRWLNPMASLIEFYREILYGNTVLVGQIPTPAPPELASLARVSLTALLIFVLGYWFFYHNAAKFGEEL